MVELLYHASVPVMKMKKRRYYKSWFHKSTIVMLPFSIHGVWQRWRDSYLKDGNKTSDAITVFTGVPTIYTQLLQGYETMEPDMQAVSAFLVWSDAFKWPSQEAQRQMVLGLVSFGFGRKMTGSSALPYPFLKQWEAVTGHLLLERYGMTEFLMAISNLLHGIQKGGTVGQPLPRVEVQRCKDINIFFKVGKYIFSISFIRKEELELKQSKVKLKKKESFIRVDVIMHCIGRKKIASQMSFFYNQHLFQIQNSNESDKRVIDSNNLNNRFILGCTQSLVQCGNSLLCSFFSCRVD